MIPPYTNAPEGEDCFTKIYFYAKNGFKAGAFFALYEVMLVSKPSGYINTINRFIAMSYPLSFSGVTFASMVCVLTNLRKKDDHLNYMIAGASAGTVLGYCYRSRNLSIGAGVLFTGIGFLMKDSVINDWSWGFHRDETDIGYMFEKRLFTRYPSSKVQEE